MLSLENNLSFIKDNSVHWVYIKIFLNHGRSPHFVYKTKVSVNFCDKQCCGDQLFHIKVVPVFEVFSNS